MSWGAATLDVNDDGRTDLYVALGTDPADLGGRVTTNRLLLNTGRGRFEDATARSGAADTADSFGVAVGDANGDGQADIVVGDYNDGYRLYLGTGGDGAGHRLVVRLQGAGPVNRDAVGTRIEAVLSDGRRLSHEVALGGTMGGSDDPAFRTGTGTATVTRLIVRWPDGLRQTIDDVPIDSEVRWTYATTPEIEPLGALSVGVTVRPTGARTVSAVQGLSGRGRRSATTPGAPGTSRSSPGRRPGSSAACPSSGPGRHRSCRVFS